MSAEPNFVDVENDACANLIDFETPLVDVGPDPPTIVIRDPELMLEPAVMTLHSSLRQRSTVGDAQTKQQIDDAAERIFTPDVRRQRQMYRWSLTRRWRDARDQWLLDHPNARRRARACFLCAWRLLVLALFLFGVGIVYSFVDLDTTATLQHTRLASDTAVFVTSPPYDFSRTSQPSKTCSQLRETAHSLRRVREAAERELADNTTCVCAPMFGVAERLLSMRVGTETIHAYNASVHERACDGADAIEHWYVVESMATFFPQRTTPQVESVRAECVAVEFVDDNCRRARLLLEGDHSYCAQVCSDLFDGRTVYDE